MGTSSQLIDDKTSVKLIPLNITVIIQVSNYFHFNSQKIKCNSYPTSKLTITGLLGFIQNISKKTRRITRPVDEKSS